MLKFFFKAAILKEWYWIFVVFITLWRLESESLICMQVNIYLKNVNILSNSKRNIYFWKCLYSMTIVPTIRWTWKPQPHHNRKFFERNLKWMPQFWVNISEYLWERKKTHVTEYKQPCVMNPRPLLSILLSE